MLKYIAYAILIYFVYLAIKWSFRLGANSQKKRGEVKSKGEKPKAKVNPREVEDAEFKEIKKS